MGLVALGGLLVLVQWRNGVFFQKSSGFDVFASHVSPTGLMVGEVLWRPLVEWAVLLLTAAGGFSDS